MPQAKPTTRGPIAQQKQFTGSRAVSIMDLQQDHYIDVEIRALLLLNISLQSVRSENNKSERKSTIILN
jgi:hypothetical protein